MSSNISYVDLFVDAADWHRVHGTFVLADGQGRASSVAFTYERNTDILTVSCVDTDVFNLYKDQFLADAREAYDANVDSLKARN